MNDSLYEAINLRLALLDLPLSDCDSGGSISSLVSPILARQREMSRRLSDRLCPTDSRIQGFLKEYLADTAPDNSNSVLALTGQYFIVSASNSTGKIRMSFPASTSRYYQLVYSTNLANPTLTNNLGWGVAGMAVTNNGAGTWFGRLRALLAAP